jgi:hypothetical protein
VLCPREMPPIFVCSHVPMEILLSMKWERSKETKRELLVFERNTIFQSEEGFNKDLPCTKIAEIN